MITHPTYLSKMLDLPGKYREMGKAVVVCPGRAYRTPFVHLFYVYVPDTYFPEEDSLQPRDCEQHRGTPLALMRGFFMDPVKIYL